MCVGDEVMVWIILFLFLTQHVQVVASISSRCLMVRCILINEQEGRK